MLSVYGAADYLKFCIVAAKTSAEGLNILEL